MYGNQPTSSLNRDGNNNLFAVPSPQNKTNIPTFTIPEMIQNCFSVFQQNWRADFQMIQQKLDCNEEFLKTRQLTWEKEMKSMELQFQQTIATQTYQIRALRDCVTDLQEEVDNLKTDKTTKDVEDEPQSSKKSKKHSKKKKSKKKKSKKKKSKKRKHSAAFPESGKKASDTDESSSSNIKKGNYSDDRVMLWNTETKRKITGAASPLRRNLVAYLANHPQMEVYKEQDKKRYESVSKKVKTSHSEAKQPNLDNKTKSPSEIPLNGDERVPLWNTLIQKKVSGNAAPMKKNLESYFKTHPTMVVYNNQDKMHIELNDDESEAEQDNETDGDNDDLVSQEYEILEKKNNDNEEIDDEDETEEEEEMYIAVWKLKELQEEMSRNNIEKNENKKISEISPNQTKENNSSSATTMRIGGIKTPFSACFGEEIVKNNKPDFVLPSDWTRVQKVRKSGVSKGRIDHIYYSPDGKRYTSLTEVKKEVERSFFVDECKFKVNTLGGVQMLKQLEDEDDIEAWRASWVARKRIFLNQQNLLSISDEVDHLVSSKGEIDRDQLHAEK